MGASIAALASAYVSWENNTGSLQLKEESARILEVVKTGDPDKAAKNLELLLSTGLIQDSSARQSVVAYLAHRKAGEGISLPAVLEQIRRQKEVEAYEMESSQIGRALEQLMRDLDEAVHPPTNPPKSP